MARFKEWFLQLPEIKLWIHSASSASDLAVGVRIWTFLNVSNWLRKMNYKEDVEMFQI